MNWDNIKNAVANAAQKLGVTDWEIDIDSRESASAEALKQEISTVSYSLSGSVTVRCVVEGKSGYASSQLVTPEEAALLTEQAWSNAQALDEADPIGLFEGSEHYEAVADPAPELPSAEALKERTLQLQGMVYAASDKVVDGSQSQTTGLRLSNALINSKGLDLSYESSFVYRVVMAAVRDGEEAADAFRVCVDGQSKDTDAEMAQKAVADALSKLGADSVDSGKYDLILDKGSVRDLLSTYAIVFSGRSAYLKTTLLAGKEGEAVANPCLTLMDDPFHPAKADHCPYDGEGVATCSKAVIEKGELKTLLYNRLYAGLMGKQTTGNSAGGKTIAPKGLYVAPGSLTEAQLKEKLGSGLYITSLQGLHAGANTQSGDFSLQAEGFLVEGGRLTRPVKNFTVAGNFFQLLKQVEAVADTVEFGAASDYGACELLVKSVSVSGK